jgi:flagellar motor switch protein FliM
VGGSNIAQVTLDRVLTQKEIDSVFRNLRDSGQPADPAKNAQPYDFRRPDRIPKDQLRAIHLLHENFARSLASSLSAYLRAYVTVNLVSVEQLSFMEFSQCLPSPTVMISLGMKPYDGNAVLEINPTLIFPILEMVLGGTGKGQVNINREITEIEQSILDGITRIILHDLRDAWHAVSNLAFSVEGHETEPQLLQILAPNEAVVAVSMEVRIGDNVGMINLGVPSIIIKMLRQEFDQQWSLRKTESTEEEQDRVLELVKASRLQADGRLSGATVRVEDLLNLDTGDILAFDIPAETELELEINGSRRFSGQIVDNGRKRSFLINELQLPSPGERSDRRPLKSTISNGN